MTIFLIVVLGLVGFLSFFTQGRRILGVFGAKFLELWGLANNWLRWVLMFAAAWPIVFILCSLAGRGLAAALVIIPLVGGVGLLLLFFDPMFVVLVGQFPWGRQALGWVALVLGVELATGVYFSVVPVASNRGLVAPFSLAGLALAALALSPTARGHKIGRRAMKALYAFMVIVTILFWFSAKLPKTKEASSGLWGKVDQALSAWTTNPHWPWGGKNPSQPPPASGRSQDLLPGDNYILGLPGRSVLTVSAKGGGPIAWRLGTLQGSGSQLTWADVPAGGNAQVILSGRGHVIVRVPREALLRIRP